MLLPALSSLWLQLWRGAAGWGIPMATDIAFALGVLALSGQPGAGLLKIFLTALVSSMTSGGAGHRSFHTDQIAWAWLAIGILIFLGMLC